MKRVVIGGAALCAALGGIAATAGAAGSADLQLQMLPAPQPGKAVQIGATVHNAGPVRARSVVLVENIKGRGIRSISHTADAGTTCVAVKPAAGYNLARRCQISSLAAGHFWVVTFTVKARKTGTGISASAVTRSKTRDPHPADNRASTSSWTGPVADLSVASAPGARGFSVTNGGPNAASDVVVTLSGGAYFDCGQPLDGGRCDLGSLAPGGTEIVNVIKAASQTAKASVADAGGSFDPNRTNNLTSF